MQPNRVRSSAVLLGAALFLHGAAASAQECKIYQDHDFKGKVGVVVAGDYVRFADKGSPEDARLPARKNRTFWDKQWRGMVSSVELPNNCSASFFMMPGHAKGHITLQKTTAKFNEELNDKSAGVVCNCK